MSALFPVQQVGLLHVYVLRPRAVNVQICTQNVYYHIYLLYPFPQKLLVRKIAHLAFVASSIGIHRVKVLHVASRYLSVSPATVGSSVRGKVLKTRHPEAYSSSEDASGLSLHRRITGSGCCRSATPSASGCSGLCNIFRNISATLPLGVK